MKPSLPSTLTKEFLLVDLVNNLAQLGENPEEVLERVKNQVTSYDPSKLERVARDYGKVRTKKFFLKALSASMAPYDA